MNKLFLKELFRLQLELQKKIDMYSKAIEDLKSETPCDSIHHLTKLRMTAKQAHQYAEKEVDALINFYMSMHK